MELDPLILALEKAIVNPLPGRAAHQKMAQFGRKFTFNHDDPPKLAGVLALFYPKNGDVYFALIQRQGHPLDPHQHQVSFPGGKKERNENLQQTAIRETYEEIGVPMEQIHPIGALSTVYVGASNFLIHPFVGYVEMTPEFVPQPDEVKEILEIPLTDLLDERKIKQTDMVVRGYQLTAVPYFDLAEKVVWGATAMVLSELRELIKRT